MHCCRDCCKTYCSVAPQCRARAVLPLFFTLNDDKTRIAVRKLGHRYKETELVILSAILCFDIIIYLRILQNTSTIKRNITLLIVFCCCCCCTFASVGLIQPPSLAGSRCLQ